MTNALYAAELIPQQTKREMFVPALDSYTKASKLVNVIEEQLEAYPDPDQQYIYFHDVCCVLNSLLRNQRHQTLGELCVLMSCESDDVGMATDVPLFMLVLVEPDHMHPLYHSVPMYRGVVWLLQTII